MREETIETPFYRGFHPPLSQMLRDLSPVLSFEAPDKATLRAPVSPAVSTDHGAMHLGVMAALMDVLGGGLALNSFYPDWAATTHLSVQSAGRALSGYVEARGELRKSGRNTVLVKADIFHADHEQGDYTPVATAILGFTRFSPKNRTDPVTVAVENPGLVQPFYDRVGLKVLNGEEALVQVEKSDYVCNSFNALHGGVAALLADLAGQTAARHATGKPFVTTDLAVHFLSLGQVGPFRTRTSLLRKTDEMVLSLVEILDIGAEDRLLSIATNLATLVITAT